MRRSLQMIGLTSGRCQHLALTLVVIAIVSCTLGASVAMGAPMQDAPAVTTAVAAGSASGCTAATPDSLTQISVPFTGGLLIAHRLELPAAPLDHLSTVAATESPHSSPASTTSLRI